jgi:hypothetical protein
VAQKIQSVIDRLEHKVVYWDMIVIVGDIVVWSVEFDGLKPEAATTSWQWPLLANNSTPISYMHIHFEEVVDGKSRPCEYERFQNVTQGETIVRSLAFTSAVVSTIPCLRLTSLKGYNDVVGRCCLDVVLWNISPCTVRDCDRYLCSASETGHARASFGRRGTNCDT